jgi:hypothetical protein
MPEPDNQKCNSMMLKKINQDLLTKYPLLWNTRVLPILAISAIIHILFFLGGYASLTVGSSMYHYGYGFYGPGLVFFSVLCSFAVLVLWLVFYLRNNAFKSFYAIGKWHLVKEMLIVMVVIFASITFFESYIAGVRVKGRSITSSSQLVKEVNTINLAMAFIPVSKVDYFILRNCNEGDKPSDYDFYDDMSLDTTNIMMVAADTNNVISNSVDRRRDSFNIAKRLALRKPDAISYLHYCKTHIRLDDTTGFVDNGQLKATVNRWVKNHLTDSIRYILNDYLQLCKKYEVDVSLNLSQLTGLPFADSNHAVINLVRTSRYDEGESAGNNAYVNIYDLKQSIGFAESCQVGQGRYLEESLLPELYVMLMISIVIICYRRFSKKSFFISLVGAVVWVIFFGLLGAAAASVSVVCTLFLFLFCLFSIIAFVQLKSKSQKMLTGIFLNWHIYTMPALFPAIAAMIAYTYEHNHSYTGISDNISEYCKSYPIGCWVSTHLELILSINLLLSLLYYVFVFNGITKKWHTIPEE